MFNKKMIIDDEIQKKVYMYVSEVEDILRCSGVKPTDELKFDCVYLLLKVIDELQDDMDYNCLSGRTDCIDNIIANVERSGITNEVWSSLVKKAQEYSTDVRSAALLYPFCIEINSEVFGTPDSLIRLAKRILNVNANDKVADICSGVGDFITSAVLDCSDAKYVGIDKNATAIDIARAKADYLECNIEYQSKDVFDMDEEERFSKIFSNYPFGLRLRNLAETSQIIDEILGEIPGAIKATSYDWIFNTLIMKHLSENGKAVAIMTNGSTWNDFDAAIRKFFVDNGYIESVIQLPSRMFRSTAIPTTMMVMSYGNTGVRIVDATKLCVEGRRYSEFSDDNIEKICQLLNEDSENSKNISIDELKNNNYTLNLGRYLFSEVEVECPALFSDVIKKITRGVQLSAKQLDELVSDKPTDYQYMTLANVKDGIIDNELPYLKELDKKLEKYCVASDEIILSKNGYPYKVAVASVKEGRKILANANMYIIELDKERANPYYIKAYFESEQGIAALKSITAGAIISSIGVENLKGLTIPLPPIEEQNKIAEEYQATLDEIAILQARIEKAKDKLKNVFQKGGK